MTETTTQVERVARAIIRAGCPGREGPFGGYDYGYPDDTPVKGGRYVIRDFREIGSPDFGKWLHQTDDKAVHEAMFEKMTREHIATAAIKAMREPSPAMVDKAWSLITSNLRYEEVYRHMIDAALAPQPHTAPIPHEVAPQCRDEVERLREALMPFVDGAAHTMVFLTSRQKMHSCGVDLYREDVERARAALSPPLS